jgi:Tol biopolymer transport system component
MELRVSVYVLAIALALALVVTACHDDATGPDAEPDEYLLFLSTRDGALDDFGRPMADIYRMDGDGSNVTNLTGQPVWLYLHMTLSPDGGRLALARACDILVMGTSGSGLTHLVQSGPETGCNAWPRWSPDGTLIAFATNREGRALGHTGGLNDAYVMNADGSDPRNVSHALGEQLGFNLHVVGWSPAGQVVLATDGPAGGGQDTRVYLVDPDGSELGPLFDRADDHSPAWSPDGSQVAFISERDGQRRLTTFSADFNGWSPRGTRIALTDRRYPGPPDIYVMDADGTGLRNLTDSPAADTDAFWVSH